MGEIQLAFGRQAHRTRGPVDQAYAQPGFQGRQALAHRRRCHAQLSRGRGKAAAVGQQVEKRQIEGLAHS
ncbi:hypothetical protein D3C75_1060930 [compost metagenome]